MADDADLIRGKNVVAVIDFHRASIFPTDSSPGQRPEHVVPTDPRGRFHKVNSMPADIRADIDELDDRQILRLAQRHFATEDD